jgi:hypothetical protein
MDGCDLGLYTMAGFNIEGVETSGSTTKELDMSKSHAVG